MLYIKCQNIYADTFDFHNLKNRNDTIILDKVDASGGEVVLLQTHGQSFFNPFGIPGSKLILGTDENYNMRVISPVISSRNPLFDPHIFKKVFFNKGICKN